VHPNDRHAATVGKEAMVRCIEGTAPPRVWGGNRYNNVGVCNNFIVTTFFLAISWSYK